ncbi:NAD-dependent epimerase/dehydratase family protein [Microvirga rosea]|uniref:NAD-dependent epimerase/dehydratase family protein n=1 Tax=Microvirga rosea TaxID=2715425 RepID=UPI001D0B5383|nr:NAD-dependent epimerase/dehydratase family protein [Microvirga rosea]MCB8821959.1 GDP-mannose 4,6-dehydratase [Microvirga rosea]
MNGPPLSLRTQKTFGFAEWFRPGEYERTEQALEAMRRTGARYVRTHLSWAEYHSSGGQDWYDWLLPRISRHFVLLPCIHYTPPSVSRTGTSAGPPHRLLDYADFIDHALTRYGSHVDAVKLWNEPNNLLDWDWRVDPDWHLFCEMIGAAGYWAQERGFRTILGGPCPFDTNWLRLMGERGVLDVMSAVGLHGFPGTWDSEAANWDGWDRQIASTRDILDTYNPSAEIWITEAGYSTWRRDEAVQAASFLTALEAPADRLYWYSWQDIAGDVAVQEGLRFDDRHYHMGVVDAEGAPKLLGRLLMEGCPAQVADILSLSASRIMKPAEPIVIIGGAGFIGCNLADSFLTDGRDVVVLDNLSQAGGERNLQWLKDRHGDRVHTTIGDVLDEATLREVLQAADSVFHLAAQANVAAGLIRPENDFDVHARGTLNVLEAIRRTKKPIPTIFASTSKVYGELLDLPLLEGNDRYHPADRTVAEWGIDETRSLNPCTPYGCSRGFAEQYVLAYARSYGLPAVVMRMSSTYGSRKTNAENADWLTRILIQALHGETVTLYGDGKQVRDLLHVSDAVAAYRSAQASISRVNGHAFNLGGGPRNAVSLREVLNEIEMRLGCRLDVDFRERKPGDTAYFVADTRKLNNALGWEARIGWRDGLVSHHDWLRDCLGPIPAAREKFKFANPSKRANAQAAE